MLVEGGAGSGQPAWHNGPCAAAAKSLEEIPTECTARIELRWHPPDGMQIGCSSGAGDGAHSSKCAYGLLRQKGMCGRRWQMANAGGAATKVLLLEGRPEPLCLAELFSKRWTQLVRSAPMDDVRAMGTRPLKNPTTPFKFGVNLP